MAEQKIVMEFTEHQIRDLDAMVTTGYRMLRDDATDEGRAAALEIVHRIDKNRRALMAGEPAPDAKPEQTYEWGVRTLLGDCCPHGSEAVARGWVEAAAPGARTLARRIAPGPWESVTEPAGRES